MNLKQLIKNTEQRFISYKKMLEEVNRDKVNFPDTKEVNNYKALLRDGKNMEQFCLKKTIAEKRNENEGLNPPFCYN